MKVLCLPDCHLKIELLERVGQLLKQHPDWQCVSLGDWADDWQRSPEEYQEFFNQFLNFCYYHQDNLHLCWGNHDYAYWTKPGSCSGYVADAKDIVRSAIYEIGESISNISTAYLLSTTLFSHAGVSQYAFNQYLRTVHNYPQLSFFEWLEEMLPRYALDLGFPLWYRPSNNPHKNTFNPHILQVVGHTPVPTITYSKEDNVLYTDTWSTDSKRNSLGDKSLVVVEPATQEWKVIPYEQAP